MTYLEDQIAELETRVQYLEDQIRILAEILDELVNDLGGEDDE